MTSYQRLAPNIVRFDPFIDLRRHPELAKDLACGDSRTCPPTSSLGRARSFGTDVPQDDSRGGLFASQAAAGLAASCLIPFPPTILELHNHEN